jgi:tripartite-type tricarboxylate transporter receptor subunit TctC
MMGQVRTAQRLAMLGAALLSVPAHAADVTLSKPVQIILGNAAGGGTDLEARLIGRYLSKYLPGNPQIAYRNIPGGNGIKAISYFVKQVKPDGYTVLYASNSRLNPLNVRKLDVEFDPVHMAAIGGSAADGTIVLARKSALPRLLDKSQKPLVMGSVDGARSGVQMMVWGAEFLGYNLRFVVGYAGTMATILALRSGELDVIASGSLFQIKPILETGEFVALAQLGDRDESGVLRARPPFDDVPLFPHLIEKRLDGRNAEAFRAWMNTNQVNKWMALPPGTPEPLVQAWRDAFRKVAVDPEFLADVRKQIDVDWAPLSGETIQAVAGELSRTTGAVLQQMLDYRKKHGLPAEELRAGEEASAEPVQSAPHTSSAQTTRSTLSGVEDGGRLVKFSAAGGTHSARISSGRTVIRVGGRDGQRNDLKAGLDCEVMYEKDGGEATRLDCK